MSNVFIVFTNPYYLNLILLTIWTIIFNKKQTRYSDKFFIFISTLQWILISGLRHITIGGRDVYISYNSSFYRAIETSWQDVGRRFMDGMFRGAAIKDPGYMVFEKVIGIFIHNYQIYLFVIAIVFMVPFGIFIYKNSRNYYLSYVIYSVLFYSFFSLTGFRQTIATVLVVLIGYEFIKERNLVRFVIVTLLAYTIHKSSIIFFPFYFVFDKKITKKYLLFVLAFSLSILIFGDKIYAPLASFLGYSNMLDNELSGTGTFTFMMTLVVIAGLFRYKKMYINNMQSGIYLNAVIIGFIFSLLTLQNQSFMRIQQYYSVFIVLLIPEIIKTFSKENRVLVYFISLVVLIALFVRTNPQYFFFWQL